MLRVVVDGTTLHDGNALPSGITVKFIGEFEGTPSAHGVLVGTNTGRVTVAKPRPTTRLHNFLIRAEVKDASGTFAIKPRIRMHVHDFATDVVLTPDPLSIRRGSDG